MIKNTVLFFIYCFSSILFSQETIEETVFSEKDSLQTTEILLDTITYKKDLLFEDKKTFKDNLKEKYSDKEFTYTDTIEEPPKKASPPIDFGFLNGFLFFMKTIFPYLMGIIVILIILKVFLGAQMGNFFNFKNSSKKSAEKLVFEDEDIHETDFEKLLEKAITDKNYRLATRYYYVLLLKKLSNKKEIEYHKDKTNTEYLFEIKNKEIRTQFSDVSYIYSYVWYGEFPLDAGKFKTVEKKYKSIFKSIH